jgi:hypothetical protein
LNDVDPLATTPSAESLENIDVALIDGARNEIGTAAYVRTDWPVMQALTRAADHVIKGRIYLDGALLAEREPTKVAARIVR